MKKTVLILSLFISSLVFSQDIVEISAKEAGLKSTPNLAGFFRGGDGVLYKTQRKDFSKENRYQLTIERYNEDLSVKFNTTIEFPDDREYVNEWVYTDNKIYLFTNMYDGANKTLHLRILDKETGKIIADKKQYGALASDPFGKDARNFIIKLSPDKTKLLIVSAFQWNKKPQEVNAVLYELNSMKSISECKIPDTYNGVLIKSYSYYLNSDGNLFYIFRNDVKEKDAPKKETYTLYNFQTKASKYKEIEPSTKTIDNDRSFLKNDVLFFSGSFIEKLSKKEKKVGTFCTTINLKDIYKTGTTYDYFPADVETKLSYKDGAGNRELSEKEITLTNLYETNNGFYLVQNLSYKKETSGQSATYIKYFSRDFIISKYNNEGKREFVKILPKYTAKEMYNADIMESNGNLYLFYCEHPKNLEKYNVENYDPSDYDDVGDIRGPVPVGVKIGADGKISRQTFEKNESWCYYPGYGVRLLNGSQMAVIRIQKDQYMLNVMKIKK